MKRFINFTLSLCAILSVAIVSAVGQDAPATAQEACAPPYDLVRGIYQQVLKQPPDQAKFAATGEKLEKKTTTVKAVVRELALSPEYASVFIESLPVEDAVRLLYERLLARAPQAGEVRAGAERARREGFPAVINSLLDSAEYDTTFGEGGVPGRPLTLRACRFPVTLRREEATGANGQISTEVTIHERGVISAATVAKLAAAPPQGAATTERFCHRVALWFLGADGNLIQVVAPPPDKPKCVGGKSAAERERKDEWQGAVSPEVLDRATAVAIIQTAGTLDPASVSRENVEKARQIKVALR